MDRTASIVLAVQDVSFSYGKRQALDKVGFSIAQGEIFGLLGPNGGGKTTLFRILSTLVPLSAGSVSFWGRSLAYDLTEIRQAIGVVFQSPSLDKKLSVYENLHHHGLLYGFCGRELDQRIQKQLHRFSLQNRAADRVESLSGGLARRVELAKSLLHSPSFLILDEPSTGLDPGARVALWKNLHELRDQEGLTIALTTHLMEEAEECDRLAILHQGRLIAMGTPDQLKTEIGGDVVSIQAKNPLELCRSLKERFDLSAAPVDGIVRIEINEGHRFITKLVEAFPGQIISVTVGKPTLADVFINKTGQRIDSAGKVN